MSNETSVTKNFRPLGWAAWRQLLVFQMKLYVDALRDLLMSPLSIIAFILDAIQGNSGSDRHFEKVLQLGRRSERVINLFHQHDGETDINLDSVFNKVEEKLRREIDEQKKRR